MCLSKAFIEENGKSKLIMEDIALATVVDDKVVLETLFGDKRELKATIQEINFTNSRLILIPKHVQ